MISIVMPVKNAAPFIKECIDSILAQTHQDWELIAVNDHSTDDSPIIIQAFSEQDDRIQLFNNTGKGIIDALSLAYEKTSGQFISRMDADDIMKPNKLQCLLDTIQKNANSIATGKVEYFSESGLGEGFFKYQDWLNKMIEVNDHYKHVYMECVLPSPNWLMGRRTLEALGGFKTLNYPEDYDLCFKAYQKKIPIVGSTETLHLWRDHLARASRNDPNYADNSFFEIKVKYFLLCDYQEELPLHLWGAGTKGKKIAQLLIKNGIKFSWYTNNPNKIGHNIYGQTLLLDEDMSEKGKAQLIIAISDKKAELGILRMIQGAVFGEVYYFC